MVPLLRGPALGPPAGRSPALVGPRRAERGAPHCGLDRGGHPQATTETRAPCRPPPRPRRARLRSRRGAARSAVRFSIAPDRLRGSGVVQAGSRWLRPSTSLSARIPTVDPARRCDERPVSIAPRRFRCLCPTVYASIELCGRRAFVASRPARVGSARIPSSAQIPAPCRPRPGRVEQLRLHRLAEPSADDADLEERRPPRGREGWRLAGLAEPAEVAADGGGGDDERAHLQPAAALAALKRGGGTAVASRQRSESGSRSIANVPSLVHHRKPEIAVPNPRQTGQPTHDECP